MKTAMQELLSEMSHPNWGRLSFDARYEIFDKLLDLEKEQICNAYTDGLEGPYVGAEQYYNETYKNEG
jgi:hypothetical protein